MRGLWFGRFRRRFVGLVATGVVVSGLSVSAADAKIPALYKNCTNLNHKWPHGLGKVGARDKTAGVPVTTFKRSNTLFRVAMSYNKGLDRDKDNIACEKH